MLMYLLKWLIFSVKREICMLILLFYRFRKEVYIQSSLLTCLSVRKCEFLYGINAPFPAVLKLALIVSSSLIELRIIES